MDLRWCLSCVWVACVAGWLIWDFLAFWVCGFWHNAVDFVVCGLGAVAAYVFVW